MDWPRDENLRLIGAAEEARHIVERLRGAACAAIFFLLLAMLCFGIFYFGAAPVDWMEWSVADREPLLIWAALACSLSLFFCAFYGARVVRYLWYRRQHRAFLRKYNRL